MKTKHARKLRAIIVAAMEDSRTFGKEPVWRKWSVRTHPAYVRTVLKKTRRPKW